MDHRKRSRLMQQFVFVGPTSLFFFMIVLIPFFLGLYYSFTSWNGISRDVEWTGLRNYLHIFTKDPSFLHSFWFTAKFTFFGLVLTNLLGFALAYVLTRKLFTRNVLRTVFLYLMLSVDFCSGSFGSLFLSEDSPRLDRLRAGTSLIFRGWAPEGQPSGRL